MSKNWLWVIPAVIIGSFFNAKRRKEKRPNESSRGRDRKMVREICT